MWKPGRASVTLIKKFKHVGGFLNKLLSLILILSVDSNDLTISRLGKQKQQEIILGMWSLYFNGNVMKNKLKIVLKFKIWANSFDVEYQINIFSTL